jgi:hypothetical protein
MRSGDGAHSIFELLAALGWVKIEGVHCIISLMTPPLSSTIHLEVKKTRPFPQQKGDCFGDVSAPKMYNNPQA